MKVSDVTTWNFTTITVTNNIISLFKRHWSDMMIIVTILACVTWKMLKKKMLDYLDDVEQYYR